MSASSVSLVGTGSLVPGTELIVDRFAYRHHGIYLGDGLVIHYAGRRRHPHGLIETIPLHDFVGRRHVHVGRAPSESLHGEVIVRRARSRLGERQYDIFKNNCEHFCNWCQVGQSRSTQVDLLRRRIQAVSCAVRRLLHRRGRRAVKGRFTVSLNSAAAKQLARFPATASAAATVWKLRAVYGGGR